MTQRIGSGVKVPLPSVVVCKDTSPSSVCAASDQLYKKTGLNFCEHKDAQRLCAGYCKLCDDITVYGCDLEHRKLCTDKILAKNMKAGIDYYNSAEDCQTASKAKGDGSCICEHGGMRVPDSFRTPFIPRDYATRPAAWKKKNPLPWDFWERRTVDIKNKDGKVIKKGNYNRNDWMAYNARANRMCQCLPGLPGGDPKTGWRGSMCNLPRPVTCAPSGNKYDPWSKCKGPGRCSFGNKKNGPREREANCLSNGMIKGSSGPYGGVCVGENRKGDWHGPRDAGGKREGGGVPECLVDPDKWVGVIPSVGMKTPIYYKKFECKYTKGAGDKACNPCVTGDAHCRPDPPPSPG